MLNMSSTDVFLEISRNYWEKLVLKKPPSNRFPYLIKEHAWMSAFAESTLKFFCTVKPSPKLSWKRKWYVVAAVMILETVNNWRSVNKYLIRLCTLITFCYRKCMLLLYTALWLLLWMSTATTTRLEELAGCFRHRLSPVPKTGHLHKTKVASKS